MKAWARTHKEEIRIGAIAAAIALFFTQGLPLWNEDYSVWLWQANEEYIDLLKHLLLPMTSQPQAWGFTDRPLQVLLYKVLTQLFGTSAMPIFAAKAVAFGALCGLLYRWMRKLGAQSQPAYLALAVFGLSTSALSALMASWDMGVFSQLILVALLMHAYAFVEKGPSSVAVYKKSLPPAFTKFLLTFFAAVYLGSKMRGDVRLAPVILLAYLYIYRREKFKVYAGPFTATFLATLPWSADLFKKLPPFLPGASAYPAGTYAKFSIARVFELLAGDTLRMSNIPMSLLGAIGALIVVGLVAYAARLAQQEKMSQPSPKTGFFLTWAGVAVLASALIPPTGSMLDSRFAMLALVPATILLGMFFTDALKEASSVPYLKKAAVALVLVQCLAHANQAVKIRAEIGRVEIGMTEIFQQMEEKHPTSQLFHAGMPLWATSNPQAAWVTGRRAITDLNQVNGSQPGNAFVIAWSPTLDTHFSVEKVGDGCSGAVFDHVFGCSKTDGPTLLRYVGASPEEAQANKLMQQGKPESYRAALEAIDRYLQRDPGNFGMVFLAGLNAYNLRDFVRMEKAYDQIGPYFSGHPSVLYNWALAKQGMQKYKEAGDALEKAYAMVPKDYSIGFNLADAYMRQGKKGRALATLGDLMRHYPNDQLMKSVYSDWSKR